MLKYNYMKKLLKKAKPLLVVLLHVVELAVLLGAVYLAKKYLGLDVDEKLALLVLAALAKFGRESKSVPLPDYVNLK